MRSISPEKTRLVIFIAALVGLFASAYLFYVYVTGAPIACGLVSGCDVVRASRWARSFGVPRPFLGIVFYTALLGLMIARTQSRKYAADLLLATRLLIALGFIESVFLFGVQWFDLRAFCLWCLLSALASTVITLAAFFDRATEDMSRQRELRWMFYLLAGFLPLAVLGFGLLLRWRTLAASPPVSRLLTQTFR